VKELSSYATINIKAMSYYDEPTPVKHPKIPYTETSTVFTNIL
jgi:hypothetical protein